MLLQAPFLSRDGPATRAVYGEGAAVRAALLELFQAAGDAARLHDVLGAAVHLSTTALAGAVRWTLARAPRSQLTVADLVSALPPLPVAHSDRPVRRVRQAHQPAAFHYPYRGRWQLGWFAPLR